RRRLRKRVRGIPLEAAGAGARAARSRGVPAGVEGGGGAAALTRLVGLCKNTARSRAREDGGGMSSRRRWGSLAIVAALALLVAAVAGTSARGGSAAGKPITIGWALDLTKAMAPFDAPGLVSAQLEIKKINAAGGVNGRKLQLKFVNTQLDPKKTKQAAASLIAGGADLL